MTLSFNHCLRQMWFSTLVSLLPACRNSGPLTQGTANCSINLVTWAWATFREVLCLLLSHARQIVRWSRCVAGKCDRRTLGFNFVLTSNSGVKRSWCKTSSWNSPPAPHLQSVTSTQQHTKIWGKQASVPTSILVYFYCLYMLPIDLASERNYLSNSNFAAQFDHLVKDNWV